MADREDFLKTIEAEPETYLHRYVYADWLDEHGEHEEAERQRNYEAAETWLKDFAAECGSTCVNWSEACRIISDFYDVHGYDSGREPPDIMNWVPITLADVVQAGHDWLDTLETHTFEGETWMTGEYFVQKGAEEAGLLMSKPGTRAQFWRHWQTVTGRKAPEGVEKDGNVFSCRC